MSPSSFVLCDCLYILSSNIVKPAVHISFSDVHWQFCSVAFSIHAAVLA